MRTRLFAAELSIAASAATWLAFALGARAQDITLLALVAVVALAGEEIWRLRAPRRA